LARIAAALPLELGIARPDVERAYPNQQSLHSGFQLYINLLQVASRIPCLDSDEGKWLLDVQAETARYVKTCADLFYKRLANAQGKRPKAFAEKL
jgi:hypothetical protein